MKRLMHMGTAALAAAVLLTGSALAEKASELRSTNSKGQIIVKPQNPDESLENPWPKKWEDGYNKRVTNHGKAFKGKNNAATTGEHEKWGLPECFGSFIGGDFDGSVKAMQAGDAQGGTDHAWTKGIDYYWCFTLKGQAHKYHYYGEMFDPAYKKRMYEAAKIWTANDPRPSLELVLALDSPDKKAAEVARSILQKMWRNPEDIKKLAKAAIEEGHPNKKRFGEYMLKIADDMPTECPKTAEQWMDWWNKIANGTWMTFEEYERRTNPFPHPKWGIGTGPVGAAWDPKVRGMRADARNTDNLRAMREGTVYLMAEEVGNEDIRRLYKEKIRQNALKYLAVGNGEWDSEGYLGHTMSAYSNLYAFAKDKEVRGYAKAILDYLFLYAAKKYYRGGWGGPVKRDYGNCQPFSGSASICHLFFGDYPGTNPHPERDSSLFINSGYRPPAAIVALARKEFSKPVEIFSSHPTYEVLLPGKDEKPETFETMYYTDTYQLGTGHAGHGYNMNAYKLLTKNSKRGVDYFIPASNRGRVKNPVTDKGGKDSIGQYENKTIWLNKGAKGFSFLYPETATVEDADGKKFMKFEDTYLAITPINMKFGKSGKMGGKRGKGNMILEAKSTGDVAGFAIEIGEDKTHGSYSQFKKDVSSKSKLNASGAKATYTGVKGKTLSLEITDDLPKLVRDGKEHDWKSHYALFQPADGSKTPCYLGWKQRKMYVEAGGHTFEAELKEDGTYTFTQTIEE
ncbi:MAG: hypothetical protein ACLFVU_13730 [Phycisphaerae bacterium]